MLHRLAIPVFAVLAGWQAGCETTIPRSALALSPTAMASREMQTRRFDTGDELELLSAAAGLLQDLGFALEASESSLGFILATKAREAWDDEQLAGSFLLAMFGVYAPVDTHQLIRASVVTHPMGGGVALRVTFQRIVWDSSGYVAALEQVDDAAIYEEFFARLSKSVFLEAHRL